MKRSLFVSLAILTVLALSVPVLAVPKLQTYIVDSRYSLFHSERDIGTWISSSSNFDLKVVGYWGSEGSTPYGFSGGSSYNAPAYDYMDCYLAMNVPRNQMGQIFVNGVEISAFDRWISTIPGDNRSSFINIGRLDNNQLNATHYGLNRIFSPGWGDELSLNVVVRGFSWATFDAIGVDSQGNTYSNSQFHDSSYYATPEPSTLSLLGLGLLGIAPLLRRKKR